MIVVLTRFSVRPGAEAETTGAFARDARAAATPGFLGRRLLREHGERVRFVLETHWTDTESYRAWRSAVPGRHPDPSLPEELDVDPASVDVRLLEQLGASADPAGELAAGPAALVLASILSSARAICAVEAARSGVVGWCNAAFAEALHVEREQIMGRALDEWLPLADARRLREVLDRPGTQRQGLLLNFAGAQELPFTLSCHVLADRSRLLLVGEPLVGEERELQVQLLRLGNELATSLRENERGRRELLAAREELDRGYWHLRRISEVLPFCMSCHQVLGGEAGWEDVVSYLRKNSDFLSHGYCPRCNARLDPPEPDR